VTATWIEYTLPLPCVWGDLTDLVAMARQALREATIWALKDRGLIDFGNFEPGAGKKLVVTTLGVALLSHFSASPDSSEEGSSDG
jgi:hypothetical protein